MTRKADTRCEALRLTPEASVAEWRSRWVREVLKDPRADSRDREDLLPGPFEKNSPFIAKPLSFRVIDNATNASELPANGCARCP